METNGALANAFIGGEGCGTGDKGWLVRAVGLLPPLPARELGPSEPPQADTP